MTQNVKPRLDESGTLTWWRGDNMYRADGPAVIRVDGTLVWYQSETKNNTIFRIGAPAYVAHDGLRFWSYNHKDNEGVNHGRGSNVTRFYRELVFFFGDRDAYEVTRDRPRFVYYGGGADWLGLGGSND